MKKLLSQFALLLTVFLGTSTEAQEYNPADPLYNVIKINPLAVGNATFKIAYEHYFANRNSSISIIPAITLKESTEESKQGWQVEGQYRFYLNHFNKEAGRAVSGLYNVGFYTGVYGLYMDYHEDFRRGFYNEQTQEFVNTDYEKDVTGMEGGALLGFQIDITHRIVLDFYVGGGIRYTDIEDSYLEAFPDEDYYEDYKVFDPEYQGVKPKVGLKVGFTF